MNRPDSDSRLSELLAAWHVRPRRDPGFRPAVLDRIQRRARETWSTYIAAHRLGWSLAALAVISGAGWAGTSAARARLEATRDEMVVSYLGNLDPRVMAKLRAEQ